jgi:hypothetical protein
MWQIVMVAVSHLLILFLALFRFAALAPLYSKQVHSLQCPLSNSVSGPGPIRGTASRLDRLVFDHSFDHSPSDISHSDHRILSNSDS